MPRQVCTLFSPLGQRMQRFFWQEDMQSVVHFVQECFCVILPATVAASGVDDSTNQPQIGWTRCNLSFLPFIENIPDAWFRYKLILLLLPPVQALRSRCSPFSATGGKLAICPRTRIMCMHAVDTPTLLQFSASSSTDAFRWQQPRRTCGRADERVGPLQSQRESQIRQ